jgi:heptaprenyl diphosphate synthase
VTEAASHLMSAGGKRFRPLLVLLAAHLGDPGAQGVRESAVVVELTHLATLYHDDVMDEAPLRRGTASANARWDNTVAILTGDFLFSKSSQLPPPGPEAVASGADLRAAVRADPRDHAPGPGEDPPSTTRRGR